MHAGIGPEPGPYHGPQAVFPGAAGAGRGTRVADVTMVTLPCGLAKLDTDLLNVVALVLVNACPPMLRWVVVRLSPPLAEDVAGRARAVPLARASVARASLA